jgi:hypothetical protein
VSCRPTRRASCYVDDILVLTARLETAQLPPQPEIRRSAEAYKRCVDAGKLPLYPPDPKSEWDFDTIPGFTGGPDGGPARSDWLKGRAWDEKRLPSLGADLSDPAARIVDAKMAAIGAAEEVSRFLFLLAREHSFIYWRELSAYLGWLGLGSETLRQAKR